MEEGRWRGRREEEGGGRRVGRREVGREEGEEWMEGPG